jgi:hypothetical protein
MDKPTLASVLMGVEDDPITKRGMLWPRVERQSGKAELGWPSFLKEPWDALQRLSAGGYQPGTGDEQGVKDSFTLAGALTGGGLGLNWAGQVPKGALGSAGGRLPTQKGITAYHGSPHDFDKFSLDKIGTGEGAQAYGHGLYFAEAEGVAKQYRDVLSTPTKPEGMPDVVFGGLRSGDFSKLAEMPPAARKTFAAKEMADAEAELKAASSSQSGIDMMRVPELRRRVEAYKWLAENPETSLSPPGRLYEVRINADPESFLDWDKPLKEQTQALQDAVAKAKATGKFPASANRYIGRTPEETAALKDAGIPGIKYLDQGSRAGGEGTRNYVVFDADKIEILKKYGWVPAGMVGGGMMMTPPDGQEGF